MTPRATYRLQMHAGFTFADAKAIVPYLDDLGISHVYCSPITTAVAGSMHGYDVVDPTTINPELGGEAAFRALVAALRSRGMGVVIDIVPNHMGVGTGQNRYWQDVLRHGRDSEYARVFDIDWSGPIILPVLGEPLAETLAAGDIAVVRDDGRAFVSAYGEHRFPIRPEDEARLGDALPVGADLVDLLDRQHYRLAWWRTGNDILNWRRFFTINDLAGVRVEDPVVFDLTQALYLRLWRDGLIDGVRIDHVDGLSDPAGYCRTLRARLAAEPRAAEAPGGPAMIWVEKILGSGEILPDDWAIDGTSGYDFMENAAAVLHDPAGEAALAEAWAARSGRSAGFGPEQLQGRQDLLAWQFGGQLKDCVDAFVRLADDAGTGLTRGMLHRAVQRLLWVFPVYRTYTTVDGAPATDARTRAIASVAVRGHVPPGEGFVVDMVLGWLAGEGRGDRALRADAVRRFQQLSAPIAAKGVEDTAFYRYGRLLSRNDVGFDPCRFAIDPTAFHTAAAQRAAAFPHALLATATHDHKRGEDVRARLAVLSAQTGSWLDHVARWDEWNVDILRGVDPGDAYMLYQMLFGAWPPALAHDDRAGLGDFAERIGAWQRKALREAKLRSSWADPDEAYEARCDAALRALCDPRRSMRFLRDLAALLDETRGDADANMLVQVALRYTVPGVPDLYQGTEFPDFSLVDPDNRRAVDYPARRRALTERSSPKQALIAELLALRRRYPALFATGTYEPVTTQSDAILAFARVGTGRRLCVAVALRGSGAAPSGSIDFGDGYRIAAAEAFADGAVHYRLIDAESPPGTKRATRDA